MLCVLYFSVVCNGEIEMKMCERIFFVFDDDVNFVIFYFEK